MTRTKDTRPYRAITPRIAACVPALAAAGIVPKWNSAQGRWADQRVDPALAAAIDATRQPPGMFTLAQAAEWLGISRQAVRALGARGRLALCVSVVDERNARNGRARSNGGGVPTMFVTVESVERYAAEKRG